MVGEQYDKESNRLINHCIIQKIPSNLVLILI